MKVSHHLDQSDKEILLSLYKLDDLSVTELHMALELSRNTKEELITELINKENKIKRLSAPGARSLGPIMNLTLNSDSPSDSSIARLTRKLEGLRFLGLLSIEEPTSVLPGYWKVVEDDRKVSLTKIGSSIAERIDKHRRVVLRPTKEKQVSIFVAMSFHHREISKLYNDCLAPACQALGYRPFRVDISEPEGTITEKIIQEIEQTVCLLADLTFARQSVYFEIGYAHGAGIPLVLTCREDHRKGVKDSLKIHFDLEQFKISFWRRSADKTVVWPKGMAPRERLSKVVGKRKTS